ncbi:RsmB/NOP family class I SAM-dependent RNA methyltransferase [Caminibacter pacificus]|uniref:16S rRNA C967 or C1407 C5-methylase (RsmB/RsmF family) n=1 Tax=Caminibacter pacificus TaxID=1424653 RepID=A0AAJ4RB95_9BACT|nr:RsmB/NOP family class I SAM-dependent RNA methyltransferase [Caminibacter pacificus]QCI27421.1 RsmB/NOP family class I SAM-dependent RNA methyltransferase [Caminibacter pacificus]ROR38858.1 16S rRNA C967 or C1407 C5-methylase (RsmB/RsmF family) [Caminibacter pacificus]
MEKVFFERIEKINPKIIDGLKEKKEFSFRINRHKADLEAIDELREEGYNPKKVEWSDYVYTLPIEDRKKVTKSKPYTSNKIYIQNLSSIIAANSLDIDENDWVLDLAAAPGGKSLIFSEKASKVSAVEPDKKRFFRMKRNFKEHGAKNIQTYNKDGRFVYKATGPIFDKVFLDAPCSSEAHIDLDEGITWWNLKRVRRFSKLQKELIISAFECLKPGGEMIYATCTFSPEENEEVIDFLLNRYDNAEVVKVDLPIDNIQEGMTKWEDKEYNPEVKKCIRILPKDAYSGFFFTKIKKN